VVANASTAGSRTARTNCRNGTRAMKMTNPKTSTTKMISARYSDRTSAPRFFNTPKPCVPIVCAIAAPTPIGANIIT
jgi:hypothetical protein